ncbi:unnamed protein product [Closterium sp. NIES-65]|nr:unnamed protein product [Closterium sp. NIES-65]
MALYRDATQQRWKGSESPLFGPTAAELPRYQRDVEDLLVETTASPCPSAHRSSKLLLNEILDISAPLNEAAGAIVDDSFWRCFKSNEPEPWNWNLYLFPLWCFGVLFRYAILFPIRLVLLLLGWVIFLSLFIPIHFIFAAYDKLRRSLERGLVEFMCGVFVASWTGVIKYHGPRPVRRANQVYVANHTSMIDFIILEQLTAFAVIMQKHQGWVGLLQKTVLESVGCIWFNRTEAKDRAIVTNKLKQHVARADANPLLIFPEGTCVNNEYTVMFKKGAFELDCAVCPIAIKYNKTFVDAFWNSRQQSFTMHLVRLMTSWAVVCDVWFMEPQYIQPGESAIDFSERVRELIARRAGIKKVPWDGYLKYYRPSPKLTEKRQAKYAHSVLLTLQEITGVVAGVLPSPDEDKLVL